MKMVKGLVATAVLALGLVGSVHSAGATTPSVQYTLHVKGFNSGYYNTLSSSNQYPYIIVSTDSMMSIIGVYVIHTGSGKTGSNNYYHNYWHNSAFRKKYNLVITGKTVVNQNVKGTWLVENQDSDGLESCLLTYGSYHGTISYFVSVFKGGSCSNLYKSLIPVFSGLNHLAS